jgi:hypothetical protein
MPKAGKTHGGKPVKKRGYAEGGEVTQTDTPDWIRDEVMARGTYLTPQQSRAYQAAKNAKLSAIENRNDAAGIKPSYGARYTSPEGAGRYPAFQKGGKVVRTIPKSRVKHVARKRGFT